MTASRLFIAYLLLLAPFVDSFSNPWPNRPLIPELAKAPKEEQEAPANANANSNSRNRNKNPAAAAAPKKREKWDPIRFLSQSSKFITLPKPFLPFINRGNIPTKVSPGDVLWTTTSSSTVSASNTFSFAPLDDVVMGGVSSSTFNNNNGKWTGTVSESNSGGFIGIRSTPFKTSLDMTACRGVELRIRGGKGKIFKAVVRDSKDFNGVCWTTTFDDGGNGGLRIGWGVEEVYTVKIQFDKLIPTIFARTVPNQFLNKGTIEAFQIAYSKFLFDGDLNPKFDVGDFSLDLLEVRAY